MSFRSAIVAMLKVKPKVAALVGDRIYHNQLPQTPTLPALTYMIIDGDNTSSFGGPSGLIEAVVQIDAWASTGLAAEALADAVRDSIDGLTGQFGKCFFQDVTCLQPAVDVWEPEPHSEPISHITQDFEIAYERVT